MTQTQKLSLKSDEGFTLLEVMVAMGLGVVFLLGSINYMKMQSNTTLLLRTISSKDRVVATMQANAGMAAALRASMRAVNTSGKFINPDLRNCAGGLTYSGCSNATLYRLTLFNPVITLNQSTGAAVGVTPMTAPSPFQSGDNPAYYDTFGQACSQPGPACPLQVSTSFTAQCAPSPLPSPAPNPLTVQYFQPAAMCTVADVINVTYTIQLNSSVPTNSNLSAFIQPITGTTGVSVHDISNNVPF